MLVFFLRRLLGLVPQLVAVSLLTYLLIDLAPGDYCDKLLENPNVSRSEVESCRAYYGFDRPFAVRYARWLGRAVTGDFGRSFAYQQPVFGLVSARVANTLTLAVTALVLAWGIALPLGVASGTRPYSWIDKACGLFAYAGLSVPAVFLALLMLLFAWQTRDWLHLPIGGVVSIDHDDYDLLGRFQDRLRHLALPAIVLAVTSMAGYMRQMRSSMIETMSQDFVRTARAKGLDERRVAWRHAFRNAVNPLITLFGYSLAALLNGSFLEAIQKQDEPLVMSSVVVAATLLVMGNLVADVMLAASDPRIRLEGR